MEPAVGALTGFFILHEILSWTQWLAIACIMIASIGTALDSKKRSTETSLADIPADAL
jgi:inner membrane transporter RhtA